jgi:hypothetical protein
MQMEVLSKLKKFHDLIGYGTRDLPAFITVPQPVCYCLPQLDLVRMLNAHWEFKALEFKCVLLKSFSRF